MTNVPADLLHRLQTHGQIHVLSGWDRLRAAERELFVAQLAAINFAELAALSRKAHQSTPARADEIAPLPVAPAEASPRERAIGEDALCRGEVAALVVAGGQGSRLGFEKPKGMYPVGPVAGAPLFRIHAEK